MSSGCSFGIFCLRKYTTAKKLLWFHFCFEIGMYFPNHNNISMHLKNSLPDVRQAYYLLHVGTVPDACGPVAATPPTPTPESVAPCWEPLIPSFFLASQKGKLSHGVVYSEITKQAQSKSNPSSLILSLILILPPHKSVSWFRGWGAVTSFLR